MVRVLFGIAILVLGCDGYGASGTNEETPQADTATSDVVTSADAGCADRDPLRRPHFGDLHVHTVLSFDSYLYDTRATPDEAYRFARGGSVVAQPLDAEGRPTRSVRMERPLDFAAVTDHAEALAETSLCIRPGSEVFDTESCRAFRGTLDDDPRGRLFRRTKPISGAFTGVWNEEICGPDGGLCLDAGRSVWNEIQQAAERANDPCDFSSFVAYEYSASPAISGLHRNVIFRNETVPDHPISAFHEPTPLGLWRSLERVCLHAGSGCDALAIPHNSNKSNGRMFTVEYPGANGIEDEIEQARLRQALEPVVEIMQNKGDSECRNGMYGVLGAPDELCDFEKVRPATDEDCRDSVGEGGQMNDGCVSRLDFVRYALVEGQREAERIGANPYKLGFIASTDTHNATPGDVEETTYTGHLGIGSYPLAQRIGRQNPGGLAAIWAEENSREALFQGLRRRETYGTSGPRITARFFGGWDYPADLCADSDWVAKGYAHGVSMGGDLPDRRSSSSSPVFVVSALRDPGTAARPGGLLQRIQIIKGWADDDGNVHQEVHEVAGSPDNGADVDLQTCQPRGPGADSICAVWTDPEFDATRHAFYYARVLENPSCRYSAFQCLSAPEGERPAGCDDPSLPKTIHERAWTSPIWYEPDLPPAVASR
jgi:hypothetical protein